MDYPEDQGQRSHGYGAEITRERSPQLHEEAYDAAVRPESYTVRRTARRVRRVVIARDSRSIVWAARPRIKAIGEAARTPTGRATGVKSTVPARKGGRDWAESREITRDRARLGEVRRFSAPMRAAPAAGRAEPLVAA